MSLVQKVNQNLNICSENPQKRIYYLDLSIVLKYKYYRTSTESIKEISVNETLGNSYPFEFTKKTQIVFK